MAWPSPGSGLVLARGECPSVHEPFAELDGALMRVRLPGGVLPVAAARALAAAVSRLGAGPLELTNRANLQVRAVPSDAVGSVRDAVVAAGLALTDPAADERRNVLASPTAGVDLSELLDPRALVIAVSARLASPHGAGVSPKFGILVDGGGAVHVRGRAHDLALGARRCRDGKLRYEVCLASPLPVTSTAGALVPMVAPERAIELVDVVLDASRPFGRVSQWLDAVGADEIWCDLDRRVPAAVTWFSSDDLDAPHGPSASVIGARPQRQAGMVSVGACVPLGGLEAGVLATLAELGEANGVRELRITPWRGVVLVDVPAERAAGIIAGCEAVGLPCDPTHPANVVVACAGQGRCASARADVRGAASQVIARLEMRALDARPSSVHVSGCEKGCARSQPADVSLVAGADDAYDMYVGVPDAVASDDPRFGRRVRSGLDTHAALEAAVSVREAT